jgi:hypothetical protein
MKSIEVTVQREGNDEGKTFVLTRMSALRAEKWFWRATLAMSKGGISIPEDVRGQGWAGLLSIGLKSFGAIPYSDAEPLLDDMRSCIQRKHDRALLPLTEHDIEDVETLIELRWRLLKLHSDFFTSAEVWISGQISAAKAAAEARSKPQPTPTSPGPSH